MNAYEEFLARKRIMDPATGITRRVHLPEYLKPHQADITAWALRRGRSAIFAGTGLGKTLMELVWAKEVAAETRRPVLILAPLAVSHQHAREGQKFGINATVVSSPSTETIDITNYQKIDHFDLSEFGGVALDESSILKNTDGKYRTQLIRDCAGIPFRLAATATPAPNDFMELGNHAEFLGVMSYSNMLATFFTHDGGDTQKWRLKGHAESEFWKWMASWSVMLRMPSDLGYDNTGYDLPPLRYHQHTVNVAYAPSMETGLLFPMEARTMQERIAARRDSVDDRVNLAKEVVIGSFGDKLAEWLGKKNTQSAENSALKKTLNTGSEETRKARRTNKSVLNTCSNLDPWVVWCHLNSEQDALEKAFGALAISIHGALSDDEKMARHESWLAGDAPVLIVKPSMFGHGLNWQHCRNMVFVGLNDSFEQIYQAVRRCWRFGQTRDVNVHFISSEMEGAVIANLRRKEADAERMAAAMVMHMADLSSQEVRGMVRDRPDYNPQIPMTVPAWLMGEAA